MPGPANAVHGLLRDTIRYNADMRKAHPTRQLADWLRRISAGEALDDDEAAAFCALLDARERAGRLLLGPYAGEDDSIDTVSGRCGLPPPFHDLR